MGRVVDCANAIFLLTSNIRTERGKIGFTTTETTDLGTLVAEFLRPELVNRFTAVVRFTPLGKQTLARIFNQIVTEKFEELRTSRGISLRVDEPVKKLILAISCDPRKCSFGLLRRESKKAARWRLRASRKPTVKNLFVLMGDRLYVRSLQL